MADLFQDFRWWRYPNKSCMLEQARTLPAPAWTNEEKREVGRRIGFGFVPVDPKLPTPIILSSERMRELSPYPTSMPERVLCGTGPLEAYYPLRSHRDQVLLKQFIKITDGQTAVRFVNDYGPSNLSFDKDGKPVYSGEPTAPLIEWAEKFRLLLRHQQAGETANFKRLLGNGMSIPAHAAVVPTADGARLTIEAPNLFAVIFAQFGNAVSGEAAVRECRHCGIWFEAGPGKKRNGKATFCSDEHKSAYFNQNRSKKDRT
jgi:hypothetical protein